MDKPFHQLLATTALKEKIYFKVNILHFSCHLVDLCCYILCLLTFFSSCFNYRKKNKMYRLHLIKEKCRFCWHYLMFSTMDRVKGAVSAPPLGVNVHSCIVQGKTNKQTKNIWDELFQELPSVPPLASLAMRNWGMERFLREETQRPS